MFATEPIGGAFNLTHAEAKLALFTKLHEK
jgi:hypothetical protein